MLDIFLGFVVGMFMGIFIAENVLSEIRHEQEINCYKQYTQKENQKKCLDIVKQ